MGPYTLYIVYALVFMTVLLVVEGLYFLMSSTTRTEQAANKRMKLIKKTGEDNIGITLLRSQADSNLSRRLNSYMPAIQKTLWAANSGLTLSGFFMLCAIVTVIVFFLVNLLSPFGVFLRTILALGIGFGLPYIWVKRKAGKRYKEFSEQLCPAIDLVARGLQAGHPAAVALEMVSKEMPDPIGTEFGLAIDEMHYGLDRNVALSNIVDRFPNPDLRFFVSALEVQRETGGNLVLVLNNLSNIIRMRRTMRKKVWAMSAEGRVTAAIVGGLPFAMMAIITVMQPGYYSEYADDPVFKIGMAVPAVLYTIGMFSIYKMIKIRI